MYIKFRRRKTADYKTKMNGVNQQGLLRAKWLKDIWNYKERDLENCKSYMLNPFGASNFAKEI